MMRLSYRPPDLNAELRPDGSWRSALKHIPRCRHVEQSIPWHTDGNAEVPDHKAKASS